MQENKQFKEYRTEDLIVYWNLSHCSHSGKCTDLLPQVFDMTRRPWICTEGADPMDIIRIINLCPSGALRYQLTEDSKLDPDLAKGPGWIGYRISEPSVVNIRMVKNGPLLVKGPAKIMDSDGNSLRECESMVLCRCGLTKNPPFCDGSHIKLDHLETDEIEPPGDTGNQEKTGGQGKHGNREKTGNQKRLRIRIDPGPGKD
jgi:uncharacterized Fe-S cluster protein YjdI/CDGSH-type Zn-finger protein